MLERLEAIYRQYGRWLHKVDSFAFEGLSGMDTMKTIMAKLRGEGLHEVAGHKVVKAADYQAREIKDMYARVLCSPRACLRPMCLPIGWTTAALSLCAPRAPSRKSRCIIPPKGDTLSGAEAAQAQLAAAMGPLMK